MRRISKFLPVVCYKFTITIYTVNIFLLIRAQMKGGARKLKLVILRNYVQFGHFHTVALALAILYVIIRLIVS